MDFLSSCSTSSYNGPNKKYQDIFNILRSLTICRYLGATGEYIEVNPMVSDYIQRNKFPLPIDIRTYISNRLTEFNKNIHRQEIVEYFDSESMKYYLKENLMANKDIPERFMMDIMEKINESSSSSQYYELMAQYFAYIENDKERSYGFLKSGFERHPESSYLIRANFDCCEYFDDVAGMSESLERLRKLTPTNKAIQTVYLMRKPVLDAYTGKSAEFISMQIKQINGVNQESKDRLIERCLSILRRQI